MLTTQIAFFPREPWLPLNNFPSQLPPLLTMDGQVVRPGALLWRQVLTARAFWHYGVYWPDLSVHRVLNIEKGKPVPLLVERWDALEEFGAGHQVFAENPPEAISFAEMEMRRRELRANPRLYGLFSSGGRLNCESWARQIVTGVPTSVQVDSAKTLAYWIGALAVASTAFSDSARRSAFGGAKRRVS